MKRLQLEPDICFPFFQDVEVLNNIIDSVEQDACKNTPIQMYLEDDADDEGPKLKDVLALYLGKSLNVACIWDCCWLWIRASEVLSYIVFDPFTELFITLCIVVNVVFMALDHYNIDYDENGGM